MKKMIKKLFNSFRSVKLDILKTVTAEEVYTEFLNTCSTMDF